MGFGRAQVVRILKKFPDDAEKALDHLLATGPEPDELEDPGDAAAESASAGSVESVAVKEKEAGGVRKRKYLKLLIELRTLFAQLQLADRRAASTTSLTDAFGWSSGEQLAQHDIHELNRILMDAVHQSLKETSDKGMVSDLYSGTQVYKVVCSECGQTSEREEMFYDLVVPVKGFDCLEDSVEDYFRPEDLKGKVLRDFCLRPSMCVCSCL